MPNMNGVEATKFICEETKTKPLILTTFDDDEYILDAVKWSERLFIKNNDPERIRDAIKGVYNGQTVMQDVILDKIKSNLMESKEEECKIDKSLFTERELSIIALIAKGFSNKEISKQLLYLREQLQIILRQF